MTTEGIDVRSVGNSLTLHETALIEAFNLKAAIEYQLKNCKWFIVLLELALQTRPYCMVLWQNKEFIAECFCFKHALHEALLPCCFGSQNI